MQKYQSALWERANKWVNLNSVWSDGTCEARVNLDLCQPVNLLTCVNLLICVKLGLYLQRILQLEGQAG